MGLGVDGCILLLPASLSSAQLGAEDGIWRQGWLPGIPVQAGSARTLLAQGGAGAQLLQAGTLCHPQGLGILWEQLCTG